VSFSIKLLSAVDARISSWKLSGRLIHEVREQLYEELAERPTLHLVRVTEPEVLLRYSVIVLGEGTPPHDFLFEFSVRYHSDEETLIIYECDYLSIPSAP